ncbi:MAG: nuclear transport factor 2 family protein [Mycobacterium leprae]
MSDSIIQTGRQAVESAVTRFFHMCNSHCPGNLAPLLTPDVELVADRKAQGLEGVNAYFVGLWESYPDLTYRVESILIDGTGAAAEATYTDGQGGKGNHCFVFQFRGDLIRRVRVY